MPAPGDLERGGGGSGVSGPGPGDGVPEIWRVDEDAAPLLSTRNGNNRRKALAHAISKVTLLQESQEEGDGWAVYWHELWRLVALATPLVASSMSGFLISMIGVAFVGHLGQHELSVVVLAASFFNVTGLSFLVGSLGALETMCGQAYGAKNFHALGAILQRAVVLTTLMAGGVCVLWTQVYAIMVGLGQDAALSAGAARFLHINVPALFFLALGEALKRYLMAQNIVEPAMVAAAVAALATPLYNWLLVFKLGLGLDGAAIAMNLAQATPLVVLLVYTMQREAALRAAASPERTWFGWSGDAFSGWGAYCRLATPSAAVVCLEWWTFEMCVLMAGWLANPGLEVAVMGLMLNISGLLYMIPVGLGSATSVRVGNALGAGLPRAARRSAYTAAATAAACQCALAAGVVLSRDVSAYLFTSDEQVVAAAAPIFPIMAWCLMGDGINATLGGMLRGAARQAAGAVLGIVTYWAVGLPLAGALAFKAGWGIAGLWTGLTLSASINAVVMVALMLRMDWQKEADSASAAGEEFRSGSDVGTDCSEEVELRRTPSPVD